MQERINQYIIVLEKPISPTRSIPWTDTDQGGEADPSAPLIGFPRWFIWLSHGFTGSRIEVLNIQNLPRSPLDLGRAQNFFPRGEESPS